MDLNDLNLQKKGADEGAKLILRHPVSNQVLVSDDGKEVSITVHGQDSAIFKKAEKAVGNKRIQKLKVTRRSNLTLEESEQETIELLSMCITSWENVQFNGKPLECTPANVRMVLSTEGLSWIREQILVFMEDRSNFLKN